MEIDMYFPRQLYLCQQGHKFRWTPCEPATVMLPYPICPECYKNFIISNIPVAEQISDDAEKDQAGAEINV